MQDTIQENLNMIVTDGSFNNASIRRTLDTKYPSVMKKSNPIHVVFKDKALFDMQNPIVGSLIAQVQENKAREREYMKQLSTAPSITDINIGNRLKELRDFSDGNINDDRNDNNDDGPGVPPTPPPRLRLPSPTRDEPGKEPELNDAQRFLLQRLQVESTPEPMGEQVAIATVPRQVTFPGNVTHVFPEAKKLVSASNAKELLDFDLEMETEELEVRAIAEEMLHGKSKDAQFFAGDGSDQALFARAKSILGGRFSKDTKDFLDYLTASCSARQVLRDSNMKIHLQSGQFYVNNRIVGGDSLYDFSIVQEDETKKTVNQKLTLTDDFDYYNNKTLSNVTGDDHNLRTNSTSKYVFYRYNAVRETQGRKPITVKHSQILKDENALEQLQNKNWQYFITTLLQNSFDRLGYEKANGIEERNILDITRDNLVKCKETYRNAYDQVANYFHIALQHKSSQDIESIQYDLRNKLYYTNNLFQKP